jgi:hypothetical protein
MIAEVVGIMADSERLETTLAAGLLAWHLAHGDAITVYQASELTGLTPSGARQMLYRLSATLPLVFVPNYRGRTGAWMLETLQECESDEGGV